MTEQPTALRLAHELFMDPGVEDCVAAAAELRRLHEAHDWQYKMAGERLRRIEKLEAQRDALLTLVEKIRYCDMLDAAKDGTFWKREIDAAIRAVEGENT